jgi:hypothetical protein
MKPIHSESVFKEKHAIWEPVLQELTMTSPYLIVVSEVQRLYLKRNVGYDGAGPFAGSYYNLALNYSRLRSQAFHPNYKGKGDGEGLSYWLGAFVPGC